MVHPRHHQIHRHLVQRAAPPGRLRGSAGVQLHRGDPELREMVCLLPHAHADDEDLGGNFVSRVHLQSDRHAAQARQSARGLHHDSRRGQRQHKRGPVPENRQFQYDAGEQPLHQVLPADPLRLHAPARSALARRMDFCRQARYGADGGDSGGRRPAAVVLPEKLFAPHHGRFLEHQRGAGHRRHRDGELGQYRQPVIHACRSHARLYGSGVEPGHRHVRREHPAGHRGGGQSRRLRHARRRRPVLLHDRSARRSR